MRKIIIEKCKNVRDNLYSQKQIWQDLIVNNFWRMYFSHSETLVNENWIDFESEISNVIKKLNKLRNIMVGEKYNVDSTNYIYEEMYSFDELIADVMNTDEWHESVAQIDQVISVLDIHLKNLIRAFELYLEVFVANIPIDSLIPEIEGLSIQKVLSFNYTDTYGKHYGSSNSEIIYDFIHGKASVGNSVNSNNMVLGIDEYLDEEEKDIDVSCISFKKYFQRIYKMSDSKYLDWIDTIKEEYKEGVVKAETSTARFGEDMHRARPTDLCVKHNLYIFGHSLDVTDGDVLRKLICNDNVYTTIYYYRKSEDDKQTLGRLITNLVKVIGSEELIRRTGGTNKTISFVPQKINC